MSECAVGNKYKVVGCIEEYGIRYGDICTLVEDIDNARGWFKCEMWDDDGVWCLNYTDVVEFVEETN